jgi:hypothetical protein
VNPVFGQITDRVVIFGVEDKYTTIFLFVKIQDDSSRDSYWVSRFKIHSSRDTWAKFVTPSHPFAGAKWIIA